MITALVVSTSIVHFEDFENVPILFVVLVILTSLGIVAFYFLKHWFFARKRITKHPITAEYKAPLDLNPAEMSLMFKRNLTDVDFAALLVHMAQRGVIHFRKHEGNKIVLPGPRHDESLKYYEKLIVAAVESHKSVTAKDLIAHHATIFTQGTVYKTFTDQVRHEIEKRGFFTKSTWKACTVQVVRSTVIVLFVGLTMPLTLFWAYETLVGGTSDASTFSHFIYTGLMLSILLFIPLAAIVTFVKSVQSRSTGRRCLAQRKLKRFWPHIIGFRQYVLLSEKDKLGFGDDVTKKSSRINTLPYAISLGAVENWRDIVT